ncbi:amino acid permease [Pseudomonas reactans]|uniref:D-alanine/D-serine/glycine permease n=1 Tax=Pseudomonas fluorescens LMG 5329 TaxID=1324332 RepID=A0A0A1Z7J9_PSEFL|nr:MULTISPECIES: amino acid permease [Pseudomonas]KGE69219.1 D-alanine/D-serine/glycine permease [Pseudomonas fluorescens LMG 5329]NWD81348.1 amino acid permease [Pseudomonas reactans]NWE04032.1 amino acid permease [Pseudomonas sp. IPO3749]NWF19605.1 amino acid permease [Pseudomonas sp. IPO3749]
MNTATENSALNRGLGPRQMNMMALGAAIGVGLFYGSASAIKTAGPAILLTYAVCGVFVFFVMRALGEMAVHNPVAGSFSRYAFDYLGHRAGFMTGWTYWFYWIVCIMAEVTAAAIYMTYWFPDVPAWIWALSALLAMGALNLVAVSAFGEMEFWFAAIKVVTIVFLIVTGTGIIVFGLGNDGVALGLSNLWSHGGFMPHGAWGVLAALPMVTFSYSGIEMIGLTAGEAKDPERSIRRVVNTVFWRIAIFYVGALFVVMSLYPWDLIGAQGSPFVLTFEKLGIREAAGIMNFVVLTAALSSCNSGIFSTGRMVFNLAEQGQAPGRFRRISARGIPVYAVGLGVLVTLIGVLLNYIAPPDLFIWLTSIATFAGLFTWTIILLSHIKFRQRVTLSADRRMMPWSPWSSYATLAFLALITAMLTLSENTRIAMIVGPIWLLGLWLSYSLVQKRNGLTTEVYE